MLDFATGPVFVSLRGLHPALFEQGVADDAVANHTQIGRGPLDGELGVIPLQKGTVHTCHHTVTIRTQGQFGSNFVSVFIGLDVPSPSRILGQPVGRNTLLVCNPRSVVDNLDGAGLRWASLSIPAIDFQCAVESLTHSEWSMDAPPTLVLHPDPHAVTALRGALAAFIDIARHQPEMLHDAPWRANAEAGLQAAFLAALIGTPARGPRSVAAPLHRARDIVHAVDAHLNSSSRGVVSVAELCAVAGTPRRTLERAFHDSFDFGPAEYVRRRALNAVRRDLLDENTDASVTDVAIAHGFWHLGRFSQQYQLQFGELPSETLRRRAGPSSGDVARFVATVSRSQAHQQKSRVPPREATHGY